MRRTALYVLVVLMTLIVTGCSSIESFYITNASDSPLEVSVKWRDNLYSGLTKYTYERFDGKGFEKLELAPGFSEQEIVAAEQKNEIQVVLQPREMLRVHGVMNESRDKIAKGVDDSFHIEYLGLKGKKGNIELIGEQAWYQFHEMEQGYFLIYR